jgi:hypothetical protein
MMSENKIEIKPVEKHEINIAAKLVAYTMAYNPLHIAIFKNTEPKAIRKQQHMFEMALAQSHNHLYAAKIDGEILGVMCYTYSKHCHPFRVFSKYFNVLAITMSSLRDFNRTTG